MNKTIKQLFKETAVDTLSGERLNQLVNITDRLMCALNCADNNFAGDSSGQKVIDEAKQLYYSFVGPKWKPTPEEIEQLKAGQQRFVQATDHEESPTGFGSAGVNRGRESGYDDDVD